MSRRHRPHKRRSLVPSTSVLQALDKDQNNDSDNDSSSSSSWSLEQDWAIIDNVQQFTVEGSNREECRTFWTQFAASIPSLSRRTPDELYERCQELHDDIKKDTNSNKNTKKKELKFGPSPPILQHWQLLDDYTESGNPAGVGSTNQAVGQLINGQTIWIKYHCIGRLASDPFFKDMSTTATSSMSVFSLYSSLGGGYLETIDGRIYELGVPSPRQAFDEKKKQKKKKINYQSETYLKATNPYGLVSSDDEEENVTKRLLGSMFSKDDWPWVPATTATMSALLATTVLSACIGYGAGLGIIADDNYHTHGSTVSPQSSALVPVAPSRTSMLTSRGATAAVGAAASSSSQQTQTQVLKPSIEELKARSEYRILKEQRMMKNLEYRIEQEQKELTNLNLMMMQQQDQQGQTQNPNAAGPSLLP